MIDNVLSSSIQFVSAWYRWGAVVAFAITFLVTLWIFFNTASKSHEARAWRLLSLLAALIVIPSAVLSFFPNLAFGLGPLPILLAFLGLAMTALSLAALILYTAGVGVEDLNPVLDDLEFDPLPPLEDIPLTEAVTPVVQGTQTNVASTPNGAATDTDLFALPSVDGETPPPEVRPEPAPPLAWIVLMNGHRAGQEFRLRELLHIGRDSKHNDVSLDDPTVSRQHARVRLENGDFILYDLASANGVSVNGKTVQRQPLRQGDRFTIGQSEFGFMQIDENRVRIEHEKTVEPDPGAGDQEAGA